MSAMIPPDIVQDGVAYWKADKVSAYFGVRPPWARSAYGDTGAKARNSSSSAANASTANAIPAASPTRSGR